MPRTEYDYDCERDELPFERQHGHSFHITPADCTLCAAPSTAPKVAMHLCTGCGEWVISDRPACFSCGEPVVPVVDRRAA